MYTLDLKALREHRPRTIDNPRKQAAVLAPIVDHSGEPHLLLTKRAEHLGEHPGQMSFPGGGREPIDDDLRDTALREAYEEVRLAPKTVSFVGQLDEIETSTGYAVRPFVATVPDQPFVPNEAEVAEVVLLSVGELTDLDNYESERREHPSYGDIRIHFFRVDGYTVWGATGEMLVQLLELVTEWSLPPKADRVVDPDADFPV